MQASRVFVWTRIRHSPRRDLRVRAAQIRYAMSGSALTSPRRNMVGCAESAPYARCPRSQEVLSWRFPPLSGLAVAARPPASFRSSPGRRRSGGRRGDRRRASPPAVADRADRQREHRLARGARGARLGADQQICRGLSRAALLRRLRVRRCRRAAGDRAREAAVRLRLRQCAAACRRARRTRRCFWRC